MTGDPDTSPKPLRNSKYCHETGRGGEMRISGYLSDNGWQVLSQNWRTRRGEIDIIAIEADTLVFIEVKTWPYGQSLDLDLVIGYSKQKRIVETAKCFLDTHRQYNGMYVRFDVIFVSSSPVQGELLKFHHLKDAFSERV